MFENKLLRFNWPSRLWVEFYCKIHVTLAQYISVSFYAKNLALLKTHHNALYERVKLWPARKAVDAVLMPKSDWNWTKSQAVGLNQAQYAIFYGLEAGTTLLLALEELRHLHSILCIEKDLDFFISILNFSDLTGFLTDPRVTLWIGHSLSEIEPLAIRFFCEQERLIYCQRNTNLFCANQLNENGHYYTEVAQLLATAQKQVLDSNLLSPEDAYLGLKNILENANSGRKFYDFYSLTGFYKNSLGCLIGAGPALESELSNLKNIQEKAVIMATDAAAQILLDANITPTFIVLSERVAISAELLKKIPTQKRIPLITLPSIHPQISQSYSGPQFVLGRSSTFGRWLWSSLPYEPGVGVSSLGYIALAILGCNSISLFGQNLAYARHGQSYAKNTLDYLTQTNAYSHNDWDMEVKGNNNQNIRTNKFWFSFNKELNQHILETKIKTFNVISGHEGSKIFSAQQIEPPEFWSSLNISALLPELNLETVPQFIFKDSQKTISTLSRMQNMVNESLKCILKEFYDDLMLSHQTEPLLMNYPVKFKNWFQYQENIIECDRDMFYFLIIPVFASQHVQLRRATVALICDTKRLASYLHLYYQYTQAWFTALLGTLTRLLGMFEKID